MKNKLVMLITIATLLSVALSANAYTIGGAYAQLVSCDYGQYGNEYGYLGTYEVNGRYYQVFFGSNYCAH
jgi:hypothetical protein